MQTLYNATHDNDGRRHSRNREEWPLLMKEIAENFLTLFVHRLPTAREKLLAELPSHATEEALFDSLDKTILTDKNLLEAFADAGHIVPDYHLRERLLEFLGILKKIERARLNSDLTEPFDHLKSFMRNYFDLSENELAAVMIHGEKATEPPEPSAEGRPLKK